MLPSPHICFGSCSLGQRGASLPSFYCTSASACCVFLHLRPIPQAGELGSILLWTDLSVTLLLSSCLAKFQRGRETVLQLCSRRPFSLSLNKVTQADLKGRKPSSPGTQECQKTTEAQREAQDSLWKRENLVRLKSKGRGRTGSPGVPTKKVQRR